VGAKPFTDFGFRRQPKDHGTSHEMLFFEATLIE
jgi:hypothetical protein